MNTFECPGGMERVDPRVRRTRRMLEQSLEGLLREKPFDKISIGEVAQAAALNRATFYAHYHDKHALLESLVAGRFEALIERRGVVFDGTCSSGLERVALAVCDCLLEMQGCHGERQMDRHLEFAMVAVIRRLILDGIRRHPVQHGLSVEMIAAAMAGALFGAAKEWLGTEDRVEASVAAARITGLVAPIFQAPAG